MLDSLCCLATEGSTNRQRPRLLLGRSVGRPRSNVALPIFQTSACSEISNRLVASFFFCLCTIKYGVHVNRICGTVVLLSNSPHTMDVSIISLYFLLVYSRSSFQSQCSTVHGLLPDDSSTSSYDPPLHAAQGCRRRGCHRFWQDSGIRHPCTRAASEARIHPEDERNRCAGYESDEVMDTIMRLQVWSDIHRLES